MIARFRQFALDTDVWICLQRSGQLSAVQRLGLLPVLVPEMVWDEFVGPESASPNAIECDAFLRAVAGRSEPVALGSGETAVFAKLEAAFPHMGKGELWVMAFAIARDDVAVVLKERLPICQAVEDLPGRVVGVHAFLHQLELRCGLRNGTAQSIATAFLKKNNPIVQPQWWTGRTLSGPV